MGNRAYLYLSTAEEAELGDGRSFAEANNILPTLWQVLLAGGKPGAAIVEQRVFGDAGTANLVAPAAPARERIAAIRAFAERHPHLSQCPQIPLQLQALDAYLQQECAEVADGDDDAALFFSANLDELAWLDPEPDTFIERCRADCDALWQRLQQAMDDGDARAFDDALELDADGNIGFGDWDAWAWTFGLGGLDHPYFYADEPREVPFAQFDPREGETTDLGDGLEIFYEKNLWGVRSCADHAESPRVIVPAEWDGIEPAEVVPGLLILQRGTCYGLMRLEGDAARVLCEPVFDFIDEFTDVGGDALACARHPDGIGVLQADGQWRLAPRATEPPFEGLLPLQGDRIWACSGGRWGLLDPHGRWVLAPRYEQAEPFTETGLSTVVQDGLTGLVGREGSEIVAPQFDAVCWDGERGLFEIKRGDHIGWLRADGSAWIAPEWERLQLLPGEHGILARRDGRWGLLDREGQARIAPRYKTLEPWPGDGSTPLWLLARDRHLGLIDCEGNVVVPLDYAGIEPFFMPSDSRRRGAHPCAHLLRVTRRQGRTPPRHGAWDLRRGAEGIACEYDPLQAFTWRDDDGDTVIGYLAGRWAEGYGNDRGAALRLGVLREDGSTLHPLDYHSLDVDGTADSEMPDELARAIGEAWSHGRAVDASMSDGERWRLQRDGSALPEHEAWAQRFREQGDRKAAFRLACQLADGGEPEPARQWMAQAAGFTPPSGQSGRGVLRRLFKAAASWMPGDVAADGEPEAMYRLARMLLDGEGGAEDPAAGRAWLEHLLAHGERNHRQGHVDLGDLYDKGIGGPADTGKALALYRRAALMNHPDAHWRLAYAYELGKGVAADRRLALRHYRESARGDVVSGAHRGAAVAIELASELAASGGGAVRCPCGRARGPATRGPRMAAAAGAGRR